jgi:hypothetical protein
MMQQANEESTRKREFGRRLLRHFKGSIFTRPCPRNQATRLLEAEKAENDKALKKIALIWFGLV